jgi:hypothetical protein
VYLNDLDVIYGAARTVCATKLSEGIIVRNVVLCVREVPGSYQVLVVAIFNDPTNALVCNKTLIQMSHTKTFKITPCFDHQMIETCWSDFKCFSVIFKLVF